MSTVASSSQAAQAAAAPSVPPKVVRALAIFTIAMVTAPLSSFYLSVNFIFGGNRQWAGLVAALVANVVVIGYVMFAWNEDGLLGGKAENEEETKKSK
ncbi:vacuolar ATPase assembly integral membrane protein VMA21 [Lipomyces tetrasporus]|uniref:Vacuolar ATPase assembly integral membrane protein VMA21 n=1 Tax=Lipomyces tetrasporus TaxID=54092 RepID=A0AAD7QUJ4_9ASCO|nr:vacuolar ATPase assembly integral membrane protein VMA21 [Lipomyces tetrasporus]KAJ8101772.1 vacuolar ATPase assembly integral membrane protein VMA21 [Lipomyces tetrasporus]